MEAPRTLGDGEQVDAQARADKAEPPQVHREIIVTLPGFDLELDDEEAILALI